MLTAVALTQLPSVPSLIPSSFATRAIGRDVSITIFTASSLNSGEKFFFGRGNYFTFPDVHPIGWTVRKLRGTPIGESGGVVSGVMSVVNGDTETVTATIPVGDFPSGLAVDPKTDTIYSANAQDGTVSVINGKTNTVTATIPVGNTPIGIAVDTHRNIYVANDGSNSLSVISGRTNTVTATIAVGSFPFGVAANPRTKTAYVANFLDGTVTVLGPCAR